MKAITCDKYGTPDVLQLTEVSKPVPKEDEVLVKVAAASINDWDYGMLIGKPFLFTRMVSLFKPIHNILGCDIAGVVEAAGGEVNDLNPGDEVYGDISGCGFGGFAEYVCVRSEVLARKPKNMSFEDAAAIPQAGVLALQGLRNYKQLKKNDKVLINGAGGGVGTLGVQIAKLYDVEMTGVDSVEKLQKMTSIGFDHVIDYKKKDYTKNGKQYDLILDNVSHRSFFEYKRSLTSDGQFLLVGGSVPTIFSVLLLGNLFSRSKDQQTGKKLGLLLHRPNREDLDFLSKLYESGKLRPVIDSIYPLAETANAFRRYGEGNFKGKVAIAI